MNYIKPKFWDEKKISFLSVLLFPLTLITLLAIFLDDACAKDFNAQIKKIASIANIKNLI